VKLGFKWEKMPSGSLLEAQALRTIWAHLAEWDLEHPWKKFRKGEKREKTSAKRRHEREPKLCDSTALASATLASASGTSIACWISSFWKFEPAHRPRWGTVREKGTATGTRN